MRIAGLEERRTELEQKLQWAAAESNQRVLTVTQELTAAHNAVLEQFRKEAAEREQHPQETLLSDSKVAIEAVRVEAAKQRQEMAAQVAQLHKELRQASTDLAESRDRAGRAEAELLSEREQRQSLAAALTGQRSQVTRLQAAMSNPTPAETQLGKELADAHENQRQSNQALSAARSTAERIDSALRDERQRRERLTTQVAELQAQLATRQSAKPDPTEKELELQKELAGAERKLQTANQTKEDIEKPWRQRVQELEQQLRSATEEQKKLQAQAVAARPYTCRLLARRCETAALSWCLPRQRCWPRKSGWHLLRLVTTVTIPNPDCSERLGDSVYVLVGHLTRLDADGTH